MAKNINEFAMMSYPAPWRVEPCSEHDNTAVIMAANDGVVCRMNIVDGWDVALANLIVDSVNERTQTDDTD